jgi:hypothetical protein
VLRLLATTTKTGRLRIEGDRGQGSVWLRDGGVVDADADRAVEGTGADEVIFELLRFGSGSFAFESDTHTPHAEHHDDVEDLLRRANALLSEWTELEAVVPSLDHRVSLSVELSSDEVTIDADRWRSVVAVGGGHSVRELANALGLSELHVSRAVRDLVELGVADVDGPDALPEPGRMPELSELSELSRRSAAPPPPRGATPPRGTPSIPSMPGPSGRGSGEHVPSGRGSGEHVPSGRGSGEHVPSGRGSGEHVSEPALSGEVPRAGWRQPEHTTGSQPAVAPDGLPSRTRAGNGQGRPRGPGSRPRRAAGDGPPSASASSERPGSRPGRRSASGPAPDNPVASATPLLPPRATPVPTERQSTDPGFGAGLPTDRSPFAAGTRPEAAPPSERLLPDPSDPSPFTGGGLLPPEEPIHHTGQIRAVSSSALPPEMHWAADDQPPGGTTGPITSPFAGLNSLGSPPPLPDDGELAPHLAAMSPEAQAAVQVAVGPSGGSAAGRGPSAGDDVAQRGRLISFLSSVR